jgi:hypothetical protein
VPLVKPGFVDNPMTADYKKGPLRASPEDMVRPGGGDRQIGDLRVRVVMGRRFDSILQAGM